MNRKYVRFRVIPAENGQTLRKLLTRRLPNTSREQAAAIIHAGGVYVNQLRIRLGTVPVVAGERITVYPDAANIPVVAPTQLTFAHVDPSFVVIDKDSGVPVDSTKESAQGTIAQALINWLSERGNARPYVGVVHRLDRRASGLVLLTTRSAANKNIHHLFVEHTIARTYRILTQATREIAPGETLRCDASLVHLPQGGVRVAHAGETEVNTATTHFRHLETRLHGPEKTRCHLFEVQLETGRTHQIRAHAQELGLPLIGELRYTPDTSRRTEESPESVTLCLHAQSLKLRHPLTGEVVEVHARLPPWARTTAEADMPQRVEPPADTNSNASSPTDDDDNDGDDSDIGNHSPQ